MHRTIVLTIVMLCCTTAAFAAQAPAGVDAASMAADVINTGWLTLDGVGFVGRTAKFQPESERVLGELARLMTQHDEWRFEVQAHAERGGTAASNLSLSERRARAVVAWLAAHGVTVSRLVARGYADPGGESRARLRLKKLNEE